MKTIKLQLYKLDELSEVAQQKALAQFQDINLDYDWWQFVYDDFKEICLLFGIEVDLEKTYFNGFYHQGQGSSYTGHLNVKNFIRSLTGSAWKAYAEDQNINIQGLHIDSRVVSLIERDIIDIYAVVKPRNRETSITVSCDINYSANRCENYDRIDGQLAILENEISRVCNELNFSLFRRLKQSYEYLCSENVVRETILTNEYDFREDGRHWH